MTFILKDQITESKIQFDITFIKDANGNPVTQSVVGVTDSSGNPVTGILIHFKL